MAKKKYTYISKVTDFMALDPPIPYEIYYKHGNKTVCIIHVGRDWSMWGEVIDPYDIPVALFTPKFEPLDQRMCEKLLLKHMPPSSRKDVLIRHNMEQFDHPTLIYATRLITLLDDYWLAWDENERAEDIHPRFNDKLKQEYLDALPKLPLEEGEVIEKTPLWCEREEFWHPFSDELLEEFKRNEEEINSQNPFFTAKSNDFDFDATGFELEEQENE